MNVPESPGTRIAGGLAIIAGAFALMTEVVIATGSFGGPSRFDAIFVDIHYLVINLVLLMAAAVLVVGYISRHNAVLLHGGLAIACWLVAHLYWTTYVYLGGTPITYPSVAELGFQGFHLVAIPLSLFLLRDADIRPYRPSLVVLAVISAIPAVTSFWTDLPIHHLAYSTFYLVVIGSSLVLAAHFLRYRHLTLFGIGLALFAVTEAAYVGITLTHRVVAVPYFDPFWYVGAALIALALLGYDDEGRLPDPRSNEAEDESLDAEVNLA